MLFNIYFEREIESKQGRSKERGRQRIPSRVRAVNAKGLNPQTLRSWPEPKPRVGRLTKWATQELILERHVLKEYFKRKHLLKTTSQHQQIGQESIHELDKALAREHSCITFLSPTTKAQLSLDSSELTSPWPLRTHPHDYKTPHTRSKEARQQIYCANQQYFTRRQK